MASLVAPVESAPLASPTRFQKPEPGRPFVHWSFDYLVIGGGLSLLYFASVKLGGGAGPAFLKQNLWTLVFLSTSAHFAGSTVRLYTKADSFRDLRFLTMGLPLLTLLVLTLGVWFPAGLGAQLQALYLTWSPYHYSAQAYGLAVMYGYRSGARWTPADTRWLRAACLAPFLAAFVASEEAGLGWIAPRSVLLLPAAHQVRAVLVPLLVALAFAGPIVLWLRHQLQADGRLPVISVLIMISNALWLTAIPVLGPLAIGAVAIFHGVQYLAILTIFHVKERGGPEGAGRPWWVDAGRFYAACLLLAYVLFQLWPQAYVTAGFTLTESMLLVVAVINIHHFIVDGYIWKLRKDRNYQVVAATI